jgi:hypothetical protein
MACSRCNRDVPIENRDTGLCATCNKNDRDDSDLYPEVRRMFLQKMMDLDMVCPVTGLPITMESEIHHMRGRTGYHDAWARENGISRLIDVRDFLAVSRQGHQWIEANRAAAEAKGWTKSRLEKI